MKTDKESLCIERDRGICRFGQVERGKGELVKLFLAARTSGEDQATSRRTDSLAASIAT